MVRIRILVRVRKGLGLKLGLGLGLELWLVHRVWDREGIMDGEKVRVKVIG